MSKIIVKIGLNGQPTNRIVGDLDFITTENSIPNASINADILLQSLAGNCAVSLGHVDDPECCNKIKIAQEKYQQCVGVVICPHKHKWFALNAEFPPGSARLVRAISEEDMVDAVNQIYHEMSKEKANNRLMAQKRFFWVARESLCRGRQARTIVATILADLDARQREYEAVQENIPSLQYLMTADRAKLMDKCGNNMAPQTIAAIAEFSNPL